MAFEIGAFVSPEKRPAVEWSAVNEVVLKLSDGVLKQMLVAVLAENYQDAMGVADDA